MSSKNGWGFRSKPDLQIPYLREDVLQAKVQDQAWRTKEELRTISDITFESQ